MAGVNKCLILGRLGKDPEIRYTQDGLAICNFSVATSEKYKDKKTGESKETVEWHRITAMGQRAETLEKYLSKGSEIFIEGKLKTSSYEKDGQTHYSTSIMVDNFTFIGGSGGSGGSGGDKGQRNQGQQQPQGYGNQPPDDDIPF